MEKYAPKMKELASRDVVSRAEWQEIAAGRGIDGCVLLDLRHLGPDVILKKLPQIHEMALDFLGIDMLNQPVPVRPGMHYIMGGVKTDAGARTPVEGLYSAGECACVSVHGGNRLGANSLLDTLVFGRHAGRNSSAYVKTVSAMPPDAAGEQLLASEQKRVQAFMDLPTTGETHAKLRLELGNLMDEKVGVYRDEAGLREALAQVHDLQKRYETVAVRDKGRIYNQALTFALELGYMLDCAETTILGAIERKESRGPRASLASRSGRRTRTPCPRSTRRSRWTCPSTRWSSTRSSPSANIRTRAWACAVRAAARSADRAPCGSTATLVLCARASCATSRRTARSPSRRRPRCRSCATWSAT